MVLVATIICEHYTAGDLYRLPSNVAHFQATGAKGATVQVESVGPTKAQYIETAGTDAKAR
jgi:hypothetical protein